MYHSKNAAMRGLNSPRQVIVYIETETGSSSNGEITPYMRLKKKDRETRVLTTHVTFSVCIGETMLRESVKNEELKKKRRMLHLVFVLAKRCYVKV